MAGYMVCACACVPKWFAAMCVGKPALPTNDANALIPCPSAAAAGYRQGIVLPAFETIDDGEEGKTAALKAIKGEC